MVLLPTEVIDEIADATGFPVMAITEESEDEWLRLSLEDHVARAVLTYGEHDGKTKQLIRLVREAAAEQSR